MALAPGFDRIVSALRNPNYGIYAAGNSISLVGTWMQRITVGWLTWELTGSGTWLGLMAFAMLFPTVVIAPIAGVAADRWDRLTLIKISQSLALIQALILFVVTAGGWMTPPLLLGLTLWLGIVAAFNVPARLALIPSLVREADIPTAIAINSVIFNCARFIGPAAAGVVIAISDVAVAFAINSLSFVVFLYALSRLRVHRKPKKSTRHKGILEDLSASVKYVAGHEAIAAMLILLIATSVCARPVVELLPGFAAAVFAGGADTLALLTSTVGVGAVVAGLWLAQRRFDREMSTVVLTAAAGLVISLLVFAASDSLWIAVPALAVAGVFLVVNGAGTQTLLQLRVDHGMRGRVLGLYSLIFRGGPAVGALAMGALSETIGLRGALTVGLAITALVAIWAWLHFRRLHSVLDPETTTSP